MALKFNCSKCAQEIVIKFLKVGEIAQCRNCSAEVVIPAQAVQTDEQASIEIHPDTDCVEAKTKNASVLNWILSFGPVIIIITVLLICFIGFINGSFIFYHYLCIAENGSGMGLLVSLFALLLLKYFSYLMIIISLIGLIFIKTRNIALIILTLFVLNVFMFQGVLNLGFDIRMNAFHKLAKRSKPLVDAIKNYEKKYGQPPKTLEILIPEFLDQVPKTGMSVYPDYKYETEPRNCYNNPWIIKIFCPFPGIKSFDEFIYFPKQNYNDMTTSPALWRVDDWAYYQKSVRNPGGAGE